MYIIRLRKEKETLNTQRSQRVVTNKTTQPQGLEMSQSSEVFGTNQRMTCSFEQGSSGVAASNHNRDVPPRSRKDRKLTGPRYKVTYEVFLQRNEDSEVPIDTRDMSSSQSSEVLE